MVIPVSSSIFLLARILAHLFVFPLRLFFPGGASDWRGIGVGSGGKKKKENVAKHVFF